MSLDNGSNETLNVYPSIEAIGEVRVLTSNYGAQYGRNASGTIEVETKSGTNQFPGSAYEFLRNEMFNAHNYFDLWGQPKAPYKKHDFGYTSIATSSILQTYGRITRAPILTSVTSSQ